MRVIIVCGVLLIFGCASTQVSPITTPSGEPGYAIRCNAYDVSECYSKAGEVCGGAYDIIDQTDNKGFVANQYAAGSYNYKTLIIHCKQQR
jgi:hypothetical protein